MAKQVKDTKTFTTILYEYPHLVLCPFHPFEQNQS